MAKSPRRRKSPASASRGPSRAAPSPAAPTAPEAATAPVAASALPAAPAAAWPPPTGVARVDGDFSVADPLGTGEEVLAVALEHIGETYVLGARAPLGHPDWKGPWDCAELASWCLYRATRIIFGARPRTDPMLADPFTGFWAEDAEAAERELGGVIVPVEQAARVAGAFVLRKPSTIRRVGHIVISDGAGGTVEAMSAQHGVRRGSLSNRIWDYGILVPRVRYLMSEVPVTVAPPRSVLRLTSPMTSGSLVEAVQKALLARGFSPGRIDGIYGGQTAHAVAAFQAANGLVVDGEVGDETLGALGLTAAADRR